MESEDVVLMDWLIERSGLSVDGEFLGRRGGRRWYIYFSNLTKMPRSTQPSKRCTLDLFSARQQSSFYFLCMSLEAQL